MDIQEIKRVLNEKLGYSPEIEERGNDIIISIIWGDWKHDHMYCDYIMEKDFNCELVWAKVIDDDDSDTYSADRYYNKIA